MFVSQYDSHPDIALVIRKASSQESLCVISSARGGKLHYNATFLTLLVYQYDMFVQLKSCAVRCSALLLPYLVECISLLCAAFNSLVTVGGTAQNGVVYFKTQGLAFTAGALDFTIGTYG